MTKRACTLLTGAAALALASVALADLAPPPPPRARPSTAVALARGNPAVQRELARVRTQTCGAQRCRETTVEAPLGGQCGYVGCSRSTVVVFSFERAGVNPSTGSVVVLVDCAPVGDACNARLADVRAR
ncbi:MAG: hypothetical protein HY909_20515 [Deltaproteobacteria bacterium]|nr:hypothetical protein [Deltaproteobacteria bacterium]